jgi:uncharacterized protein YabE (DUF348 family)/3D (Asp-Asp-Asp) domain-containing protein
MIRITPNGHLHVAIVAAFLLSLVVAIAIPISRSAAAEDTGAPRISSSSFTEAIGLPAGPLTEALTTEALSGRSEGSFPREMMPLLAFSLIPEPLLSPAGTVVGGSLSGMSVFAKPHVTFSVHQDGLTTSYSSALATVGEALAEAGVTVGPSDVVYPGQNSAMTPGLHVFVDHAITVNLIVGGEEEAVQTQAATVGELLEEQQVDVQDSDKLSKKVSTRLRDGMTIRVTTIREAVEYIDEPIPFRTVYTHDSALNRGEQAVRQAGKMGHLTKEYLVRRVDGQETKSELLSETLTAPVDRIVAIGTRVPPATQFSAGPGEEISCAGGTLRVWATWYTAASAGGSGITRTGTGVYKGIIAVDPTVIPLGTQMYVPGYGFGIAADTGGAIKGNKIDLGYGANDVKDWHTGYADICIIG